jgi:hypothetical protein
VFRRWPGDVRGDVHPGGSAPRTLLPLEPKFSDPEARRVVAHNTLDILGEAIGGLGINIECQRDDRTAGTIQFAQDLLVNVADEVRTVRVDRDLGVEAGGARRGPNRTSVGGVMDVVSGPGRPGLRL